MKKTKIFLLSAALIFLYNCNGADINVISESGTIESTEVTVSSKVVGEVKKILKDEGTQIAAGDTILIIDHEALDIQLRQMTAGRDIAKAQLDLLIKGARHEDIQQVQEQLNQAEANFGIARSDKKRMENLFRSQAITKKQYEDASARLDIAQAQLNAAKENFNKIKNIARPEEITQAQANFEKAEASVDAIRKNIRDCYLVSPMNGFIVKNFTETGETVSLLSSLVKIADLSKVEVVVYVSETDLGKVKLGQKTELKVDSFPERVFEGKVVYISPEAEFTPKNIQTKDERTKLVFAVKTEIPNPKFELKTGMPADVRIIL